MLANIIIIIGFYTRAGFNITSANRLTIRLVLVAAGFAKTIITRVD